MINCTVSMFGDLGVGFISYPNEKATNEVFQTFRDKVWAHSSLVTHRDGRKMYYAYLRQIVGKQYICFCVMLNDAYFTNLRELFTLFEEVFNDVQKQGVILGNDSKGRLIAKVKNLSSQQEEVDRITGYIRQRIEMVKDVEYPLPQIGELKKWSADDIDDRRFKWDNKSDKVYKKCLETDYIVISKDDASTGRGSEEEGRALPSDGCRRGRWRGGLPEGPAGAGSYAAGHGAWPHFSGPGAQCDGAGGSLCLYQRCGRGLGRRRQ